ncbi:hypothetical protein BJ170DRAFT_694285 [Xylariales sp. AK1849]|nr:hypothetical protein BJ170DRAFT_694285 [Xylariales sp. AK1849]
MELKAWTEQPIALNLPKKALTTANIFTDAFLHYHLRLGLAGSVIDIREVEVVEDIDHHPSVLETFKTASAHAHYERDLLDYIEMLLSLSSEDLAVVAAAKGQGGQDCHATAGFKHPHQIEIGLRSKPLLSDPENVNTWRPGLRFAVFRSNDQMSAVVASLDNEGLGAVPRGISRTRDRNPQVQVPDAVGGGGAGQPHRDGRRGCAFTHRHQRYVNRWRPNLGTEIAVLEMLNGRPISQSGELAVKRLKEKDDKFAVASESRDEVAEVRETGDSHLLTRVP